MKIAILGLGEAGSHFANDLAAMGVPVSGWDPVRRYKLHQKVNFATSNPVAVQEADIVLSVNLTAVSVQVAEEVSTQLKPGAIYCEMNTSSPQTKLKVQSKLTEQKVSFVDLAIMAPVPPRGIKVPLLASGPGAAALAQLVKPYKLQLEVLSNKTGDAAGRKLLRSIIYKGVAAVICEAMEAGQHFGLESYIRSQIHSIIGENDTLIDRFVEGSRTHAERRMHEMEAVVTMLEGENLGALMSSGTVASLKKYLQ